MTHPKTYPYGFCLLPRGRVPNLPDSYATEALAGDYELSFDTSRAVVRAVSTDGTEVLVYGRCYVLGQKRKGSEPLDAAQFLAGGLDASPAEFLDRLDLLAGRWIALTARHGLITLYHDAVGTRSVYFDAEHGAAASHSTMLGEILDRKPSGVIKPSMTWGLSNFQGITALLPNHRLQVRTGTVERYWPRETNPWTERSEEARLQRVIDLWHEQMDQVMAAGLPVCCALSGGLDSRVSLALSAPYMDRIRTYTYGASATARPSSAEVLNRDVALVEPLVRLLGLDHQVIQGNAQTRGLQPSETEAIAKNSLAVHGRWLIPHYLEEFPAPDGLVLRANAFEVGQHKWASPTDDDPAAAARTLWLRRARIAGVEIPGSSLEDHVDKAFAAQGFDGQLHGYLASDLTHWEFRLGRWAAEAFNEIDLAFEPLVPLNCRATLTPLLAFERQQRASHHAFRELINMACPVLNFFGINDATNLYENWRDSGSTPAPAGLNKQIRSGGALALPVAEFNQGHSETAQVFATPLAGRLCFDVETFWSNASGDRTFEYRILVGGRPILSIAGASPAGKCSIEVENLRADSVIELSIVALRTRAQPSWERATNIRVDRILFESAAPQGEITATISPHPAP